MPLKKRAAIAATVVIVAVLGAIITGFRILDQKPKVKVSTQDQILPWLVRENGTLLDEDFSSRLEGWILTGDSRRSIDLQGNWFGICENWGTIEPPSSEWSDYTLGFRASVSSGAGHIDFRVVPDVGFYSLELNLNKGYRLLKTVDRIEYTLFRYSGKVEQYRWYQIKIEVKGNIIRIFLDGQLSVHYTDDSNPYRVGGCRFRAGSRSVMHIDDLFVHGMKLIQSVKWQSTNGPPGGIGFDIAVNPKDHRILFAADNPSGILKSEDGGRTWKRKNRGITAFSGPSNDGIPIYSVAVDPNDPKILWAGASGIRGVYKSIDGGESWTRKDKGVLEWGETTVRGFAIKPGHSRIALMAMEIGTGGRKYEMPKSWGRIYLTTNEGETWTSVWNGTSLVQRILFDHKNPQIAYACTGSFDRVSIEHHGEGTGILKSTDGGGSWKPINNGLEVLYIGSLAMDPTDTRILYTASGAPRYVSPIATGGVYKTTDGGESWKKILGNDAFTMVAVSQSNPRIVYAASEKAFFRSDNGGATWTEFCHQKEIGWGPKGLRIFVPTSCVVDREDPLFIVVNTYLGGIVRSEDGGKTWLISCQGYASADLQGLSCPVDANVVYAIGRSGPFRSLDGGKTWEGIANGIAAVRDWYSIATNPRNHREVLVSDQFDGRIFKSITSGSTWQLMYKHPLVKEADPNNRHGFKVIVYAPSNLKIVYAGMRVQRAVVEGSLPIRSSYGVFKSVDGGETWREMNRGLEKTMRNINAILIDPKNPDIVYIGLLGDGVFRTTNGGASWIERNTGLISLDVRSLALDPTNSSIVYAGLGEGAGIFMSVDEGRSWQAINNGIRVECPSYLQRVGQVRPGTTLVKASRVTRGDFYSMPWTSIDALAMDMSSEIAYTADFSLGVYVSPDGGASWHPINYGLTNRAVCALSLSPDGRTLFAATSGGGVYRLDIPQSESKVALKQIGAPTHTRPQSVATNLMIASETQKMLL